MVPYIENLDLFEDYPRAVEDEDYDTEDLFASYKRYSVPHIDDIIFRMSYDADFYAMLGPQTGLSLEDGGGRDFVVEPKIKDPAYDYPREAADAVDEDWYSPHPELNAVLAGIASLQLEASHISSDDEGALAHLTIPDVPFDATAFQTIGVYPDQEQENETGIHKNDDTRAGKTFDVRLSLLFPSERPQNEPLETNDVAPIH